jgi:autotransporter passenger strand-loop-strand repeat protein
MTTQVVFGGPTTVSAPTPTTYIVVSGTLDVASGGVVSGATAIGPGSIIMIEAGGTANNSTVVGGVQFNYGTANGVVISNGGIQHVYGGTANNVVVSAGSYQDVMNATVNGTTLAGSQQVHTGGVTYATVIVSGGNEFVAAGGTTNGTIISSGGLQYVGTDGTANGSAINNGGYQYVLGTGNDTVVFGGGVQEVAGTTSNTIVNSGGIQHVVLDGTAITTTVQAGGFQQVNSGSVQGSQVSGSLQVLDTGTSADTVILAGGNEYVGSGASATGTTVNAGGLQYVDAGGSAASTTVNGGFVFVAGSASGAIVNSGEFDVAGTASNTHLAGGAEYVYAGGVQNGVDFAGSASTLYLENASGLTGTIANFEVGDVIDFRNLAVTSYAFDGATLTLTTSNGSLAYQFAGVEANTALNVASDGHGGTSVSLSLLSQFSASLVPDAGEGAITPSGSDPQSSSFVHAQS